MRSFPFGFLLALPGFILLFIYLFGFSIMLNIYIYIYIYIYFGFWCSLFYWFYNFVVPKLFSSNVLIVVLTSFVFLFILMLYNIKLIRLDIFLVYLTGLRLVIIIISFHGKVLTSLIHYECTIP